MDQGLHLGFLISAVLWSYPTIWTCSLLAQQQRPWAFHHLPAFWLICLSKQANSRDSRGTRISAPCLLQEWQIWPPRQPWKRSRCQPGPFGTEADCFLVGGVYDWGVFSTDPLLIKSKRSAEEVFLLNDKQRAPVEEPAAYVSILYLWGITACQGHSQLLQITAPGELWKTVYNVTRERQYSLEKGVVPLKVFLFITQSRWVKIT